MIVGTAGHIDHGKTALVRALTGVETDRLVEEKERGISIALGYAYHPLPNNDVLGFVDVPGHERLIHTMLAGAAGIDFFLLIVAADDGIMPQTLEHLEILELLAIESGAVALTKIDRVESARVSAVRREIETLFSRARVPAVPIFPVSSLTSNGIDVLRRHLCEVAVHLPKRRDEGLLRLAVDRSFTLRGVGTVVTGTVFSGTAQIGAELKVVPSGKGVRVRGLHAQDRPAAAAHAGQRCALNLAGIDKDEVPRGAWIAAAPLCIPVDRFDARLTLSSRVGLTLRQWSSVHLHLGAAHVMAHVVLLQGDHLPSGETALTQIVLERPIGALRGDRFIIRDAAARHTLGGGRVLDIFAPVRKRRTPERLAELSALECESASERLRQLLDTSPWGLDIGRLQAAWNCPNLATALPTDARRISAERSIFAVAGSRWQELEERVLEGLAGYHERQPAELGPDLARARRMWLPRIAPPIFNALVEEAIVRGKLKRTGAWLHRPEHDLRLTSEEDQTAQRVLALLGQAPLDSLWVRDLARALDLEECGLRQLMRKMSGQGMLYQIVRDLFFVPEAIDQLTGIIKDLAAENDGVRASTFRDRTGLGRKRSIQILEYFDRVGLTRRVRDVHRLRADSPLALRVR